MTFNTSSPTPESTAPPSGMAARRADALTDRDAPLVLRFEGLTRLIPLLVCGGFVIGTVVLLVLGPLDWHLQGPVRVFTFLAAALAMLVGGYLWATLRRSRAEVAGLAERRRAPLSASTLVVIGAIIYLVLYPPTVHTTTGSWLPNVWQGLTDSGTAYANNKYYNENGNQIALYLRMLVAPITILILPLTLYFWPRLSSVARFLGVVCVVASVALTIAQGINRGVAELAANIILFLALTVAATLTRKQYGKALKGAIGIVLVGALFASYYSITINNRIAADAERDGRSDEKTSKKEQDAELELVARVSTATKRSDSIYYAIVPDSVESVGVVFNSYVTHGYKGLDLAMQEPFKPTWGLGFSEFGRHNVLRLIGQADREEDVVDRTYAGQIDAAWPVGQLWGTFFIHPASDIGFPGTAVLIGLIGFLFGLSWRDTLVRRDPLACGVFFHLCILVMYIPANNQLFQGGELTIGFTVLTAVWLWRRRLAPKAPDVQRS